MVISCVMSAQLLMRRKNFFFRVRDVVATYDKAPGQHGPRETSDLAYTKELKKKFVSIVGTPAWADLDRRKKKGEDSDDEFFRVRRRIIFLRKTINDNENDKRK